MTLAQLHRRIVLALFTAVLGAPLLLHALARCLA